MWESRKKSAQAIESNSCVLLCHCVKCASCMFVLLKDRNLFSNGQFSHCQFCEE